jgi:hypothetical protein
MAKIIKHDDVDVSGAVRLQCPGAGQNIPAPTTVEPETNDAVQVRLVDRQEHASIIEVTCACGHVIQVCCEH